MKRFSEYVSPGHPDKMADYISSYILDRYIEQDPETRYAVEVQVKDNRVTLGGEVSSRAFFDDDTLARFVREAVNEIGYTVDYGYRWGHENTVSADIMSVQSLIRQQSPDIARGLTGWGDQGIFFGYAEYDPKDERHGMPLDHTLAKRLCKTLFESGLGGLDIKTQVITGDGKVTRVIVAIPLMDGEENMKAVRRLVRRTIPGRYSLTVNGTGRYVQHSTIADCGTTGRKLAVDFYGGNCVIGGGSPWTKDASKADLTLNLCARKLARGFSMRHKTDCVCALACCIGKKQVDVSIRDTHGNELFSGHMDIDPAELRHAYGLDTPIYASMCRWGLFGEFQSDKMWEK